MLRRVPVLLDEALNLLETGDDAFLAWRVGSLLLRLGEVVEFAAQVVEVEVTHNVPRP